MDIVIKRAMENGVQKFLFASGNYSDAIFNFELCQKFPQGFTTIGIHPCHSNEVKNE